MINIDSVRKLILIACLLAIAISITDMLYPAKKFSKQMRLLFSLTFVIGIITPIITGSVDFTIPASLSMNNSVEYENMDKFVYDTYEGNITSNIEHNILDILNKNKINVQEISVSVNINEDNSIDINEVNIITDNSDQSDQITNIVTSEVGVQPNIIERIETDE